MHHILPSLSQTEEISITLFERFDNNDFGLHSVELLMHNEHLQLKQSKLRVKTVLHGIRRFMVEW
jgi:hypothetical protein